MIGLFNRYGGVLILLALVVLSVYWALTLSPIFSVATLVLALFLFYEVFEVFLAGIGRDLAKEAGRGGHRVNPHD